MSTKRGPQPGSEGAHRIAEAHRGAKDHDKKGGFAANPDLAREAGRKGGVEAHRRGTAHRWTSEEARAAGSKGGAKSRGGGRPRKNRSAEQSEAAEG